MLHTAFPARIPMTVHSNTGGRDPPRPPNPPPMDDHDDDDDDSFEFFSLRRSPPAMCAADDVFLAGKLLPFFAPPPSTPPPPHPPPHPPSMSAETHIGQPPQEKTAEASEAARTRRFWAGRGGVTKANYRRLRPVSDSDVVAKAATTERQRPRWYLLVLGSMRVPATMDMSDIRSRQQRIRCAPSNAPETSVEANRSTWKLLRSLSCKGLESAGVAVTFGRDLQGA